MNQRTPSSILAASVILFFSLVGVTSAAATTHVVSCGTASSPPSIITYTVNNEAGVRRRDLVRVERAVTIQAQQLRCQWGTPLIRFGPGGWRVIIEFGPDIRCNSMELAGCHLQNASGAPLAIVPTFGFHAIRDWSITFSHEVIEMTADPYLSGEEVCDPVYQYHYLIGGVPVSDFALPAYFANPFYNGMITQAAPPPYDEMGKMTTWKRVASIFA